MGITAWFCMEEEDVLIYLETDPMEGLTQAEAQRRMVEYGPNELIDRGRKSPWRILWEQLTAIMVVILIIAAVISFFLGDSHDAIAIMVIVVLNAILGFTQENRAENAIAALKKMAVPIVKVRRDAQVREISASKIAWTAKRALKAALPMATPR